MNNDSQQDKTSCEGDVCKVDLAHRKDIRWYDEMATRLGGDKTADSLRGGELR